VGILTAELDVAEARIARRQMDPMGHYARPDVFRLSVDTAPRPAVAFGER
jgi:nitrilase